MPYTTPDFATIRERMLRDARNLDPTAPADGDSDLFCPLLMHRVRLLKGFTPIRRGLPASFCPIPPIPSILRHMRACAALSARWP